MASDHEEIAATLATPGARILARYMRRMHREAFLNYRMCQNWDEVKALQHKQYFIDTVWPEIIEGAMNKHLPKGKKREWSVWEWLGRVFRR